jgi:hypothetical protein
MRRLEHRIPEEDAPPPSMMTRGTGQSKRGLLNLSFGLVMMMPASTCDGGAEIAPKNNHQTEEQGPS